MRRRAMTTGAMAQAVGVSPQHLCMITAGTRPGIKHLPRIAEILGVRLEWLTTGEEPMVVPALCPHCGRALDLVPAATADAPAPADQEVR